MPTKEGEGPAPPLRRCFVIAPIGAPGSETRKRSDQVIRHLVEPVVTAHGFDKPLRADNMDRPGMITSQIVAELLDADLVVADLADRNPNVFYELAVRHAAKRPVVQIVSTGEKDLPLPFDIAGMRTVVFELKDPDDLARARAELERHVLQSQADNSPESPILAQQALQLLRSSGHRAA